MAMACMTALALKDPYQYEQCPYDLCPSAPALGCCRRRSDPRPCILYIKYLVSYKIMRYHYPPSQSNAPALGCCRRWRRSGCPPHPTRTSHPCACHATTGGHGQITPSLCHARRTPPRWIEHGVALVVLLVLVRLQ